MVKGAAYLILALLIMAALAWYLVGERRRSLADIDRRLAQLSDANTPSPRQSAPLTVPERLAPLLAQAQLEVTASTIRTIGVLALLTGLGTLALFGPAVTLLLLIGVPFLAHAWVSGRARKRIDALTEALPHYIDGIRQLQAVGNSLSQALERALAEAPDVIQSYFSQTARKLEMGAPVGETMQQLADRLRVAEISMLAAAIKTNLRYGGSITSALRNLSNILRERLRIKRELLAATSEAKVSSRVLIAMPLIAMALLVAMNPSYIDFFVQDARGHTMVLVALVLEFLGIFVMRRTMRLDF